MTHSTAHTPPRRHLSPRVASRDTKRRPIPKRAPDLLNRIPWTAARRLLHQQLWCWGQDMKSPDPGDNPLMAEGFVRHARPPGQRGTSRYELDLTDGSQIVLWGYGAWFRAAGQTRGTLLVRHRPGPHLVELDSLTEAWFPDQLPELAEPMTPTECETALANLEGLCNWIAGYETRVKASRGNDYRDHCHRAFEAARRHCPPDGLPDAWRSLLRA